MSVFDPANRVLRFMDDFDCTRGCFKAADPATTAFALAFMFDSPRGYTPAEIAFAASIHRLGVEYVD